MNARIRIAAHLSLAAIIAAAALACGNVRPALHEPEPERTPEASPPRRISIVFGGDVMQHMPQINAARRDSSYDYTETFHYLRPFLDTADLVVFNLETTLSTERYSGYPLFSAPAELAPALRNCGVDAVTLANNHMLDKGRKGVLSTIRALDSAGLRHTGVFADSAGYHAAHPLIFDVHGVRVALLNYTYGLNGMPVTEGTIVNRIDTARIAVDLAAAAERGADVTVAYFHWGYEYHRLPNTAQKQLAAWCHERGADFVIGCHPHVIQPVEVWRDSTDTERGLTAYSLGNLVSNQRKRYRDGGILLRLDITLRDSLPLSLEASYLPVWVHMPVAAGQRKYVILPSPVADTMALDAAAKNAYDVFMADTRELLGSGPAREIKYVDETAASYDIRSIRHPVCLRPGEVIPPPAAYP